MKCFPRENSEKIKVGTFGALPGPVGAGCSVKMGLRGRKAKKAECVGMGIWGVKIGQKPKKSFFSEKAKWVLSFKKKIWSLAPEVRFLAQVEFRADFRVWPKIALGGDFWPILGQNEAKFKKYHRINQKGYEAKFFFKRSAMKCFPRKNSEK